MEVPYGWHAFRKQTLCYDTTRPSLGAGQTGTTGFNGSAGVNGTAGQTGDTIYNLGGFPGLLEDCMS